MFGESHARHHRYTLHVPDDLEVVLPQKMILRHVFVYGIFNYPYALASIKNTVRIARDKLEGDWEPKLFPLNDPNRWRPVFWARILLVGHGLIILVSIYFHLWLLPVLTVFGSFFGGGIQYLCNNTQHIGLQDDVSDFRLCCRTFTINPLLQFLYWHMNFHIEHHMFAAVPCYRLGRLHRLIKHDLPPCPHGLIATWREIFAIQEIQKTHPDYQHVALLPGVPISEKSASLSSA